MFIIAIATILPSTIKRVIPISCKSTAQEVSVDTTSMIDEECSVGERIVFVPNAIQMHGARIPTLGGESYLRDS
jgi:hypothetical protein